MASDAVLILSEGNFDETVMKADKAVLVDFWADWCGPCRMLAPTIDALAGECGGRALVCKVNVDDNNALAARYGVMSIPTVIVFKDGEESERFVGVQPKETYLQAL